MQSGRGRWSTAVGLTIMVVLLSVFDGLPMVLLPLAIMLVALPGSWKWGWGVGGIALAFLVLLVLSGGPLAALSRGWGMLLGAFFLAATLLRPDWSVTGRAIGTVAAAFGICLIALLTTGEAAGFDAGMNDLFTAWSRSFMEMQAILPDSIRGADPQVVADAVAQLRSRIYPALLGLQSVAALALVAWWIRRLGRSESPSFMLSRMRDFRFNDQLIWALIVGIICLLIPSSDAVTRVGANLLVFMGGLYVLRGVAIFVFLATGSRSVPTMVFGALVVILLYPVAFTAALLMGVGDTWLDVRGRIVSENPA